MKLTVGGLERSPVGDHCHMGRRDSREEIRQRLDELRSAAQSSLPGGKSYLRQPLSNHTDLQVIDLIDRYTRDSNGERQLISQLIGTDLKICKILLAFGSRMASLAVRTKSARFVQVGLTAVVIVGFRWDFVGNVAALKLLDDAIRRIDGWAGSLFPEAARLATDPRVAHEVMAFLQRRPEDRSLKSAGHLAVEAEDGFRYFPDPAYWSPIPEVTQLSDE
jgi:hypothetical protein